RAGDDVRGHAGAVQGRSAAMDRIRQAARPRAGLIRPGSAIRDRSRAARTGGAVFGPVTAFLKTSAAPYLARHAKSAWQAIVMRHGATTHDPCGSIWGSDEKSVGAPGRNRTSTPCGTRF